MYKIETCEEQNLTMYRLHDEAAGSWMTVCPERGGIVTSFGVKGEEHLYMNKETLYDWNKSIRGGIPILFPISGQLREGKYQWDGQTYQMPNHGVARINEWEVTGSEGGENSASITLRLTSDSGTKEFFPFDFELVFTYVIEADQLTINQTYRNLSGDSLPMYPGFHPYFHSETKQIRVETDATEYLDYNDEKVKKIEGSINLEGLKESVALLDADDRKINFQLGDSSRIEMETGPEFAYTVLWTEAGKDFVCIEPWMAKNEELNRQEELQMVPANGELNTFVTYRIK